MTLLAIIGGIMLGVVSNEVFDVLPWAAKKILHAAARLDARYDEEAELLFDEWNEHLEGLPGKLTKFAFAAGLFLRVALPHRFDQAMAAVASGQIKRFSNTVRTKWPRKFVRAAVRAVLAALIAILLGLHNSTASTLPENDDGLNPDSMKWA